mmetsp:Transcript_49453/g.155039  ORF Transcript_49453/g.155039 Transcript_49453/m.155039 type:complete len:244 (+) Transcript_49453:599-1330(+)
MDEDGFDGVASRGILDLAVCRDLNSLLDLSSLVDEDVADAVGMAEDGDVGVLHDVLYEGVGSPRDDEIDILLHLHHLCGLLPRGQESNNIRRGLARLEPVLDRRDDGPAASYRLPPALEEDTVTGLDPQRGNLNSSIGTSLEDDAEHTEGDSLPLEHEALIELPVELDAADRILELHQVPDTLDGVSELGAAKLKTSLEGRSNVGLRLGSDFTVGLVGCLYLRLGVLKGRGDPVERVVPVLER